MTKSRRIRKNDKRKRIINKIVNKLVSRQLLNELPFLLVNLSNDKNDTEILDKFEDRLDRINRRKKQRQERNKDIFIKKQEKRTKYYIQYDAFLISNTVKTRQGVRLDYNGDSYALRYSDRQYRILRKYANSVKNGDIITINQLNRLTGLNLETIHPEYNSLNWVFKVTDIIKILPKNKKTLKKRVYKNSLVKKVISNKYQQLTKNENALTLYDLVQTKTYAKDACWLDIIINHYHKTFAKKCKKFPLTVENLVQFLGAKEDYGYTIDEVLPFYKKFKLYLECYDLKGNLIYHYSPTKPDGTKYKQKHHKKTVVCLSNNHVYPMNRLLKSLVHKLDDAKNKLSSDIKSETVVLSNDFKISKMQSKDEVEFMVCNNKDDLAKAVIFSNGAMEIICTFDLKPFIIELYNAGILPEIKKIVSKNITTIGLAFDTGYISICNSLFERVPNFDIEKLTKEQFNKFKELKSKLFKSVVSSDNKSYYNDDLMNCFDKYSRYALVKSIGDKPGDDTVYEIDDCKAYTDTLKNIKQFGVFTVFDKLQKYNGEDIEYCNFYIVRVMDNINDALKLIFDKKHVLLSGMCVLELLDLGIDLNIRQYIKPYKTVKNNSSVVIDEIFDSNLPEYLKKFICNQVIGSFGKKYNKKQFSMLTDSEDEMLDFSDELVGVEFVNYSDNLKIGDITYKKRLNSGFYHLQHMVYCYQRIKLYKSALMAQSCGGRIIGCKTDAVYFVDGDIDMIKPLCTGVFGGKKLSIKNYDWNAENLLEVEDNRLNAIKADNQNRIYIEDEWDNDEIDNAISNNYIHMTADYAGCGKSYAFKRLNKVLFVCPYRRLCYELLQEGINAITMDKFLGIRFNTDTDMKAFDISQYKHIVFDEINCHSVNKLNKLKLYLDEIKNNSFGLEAPNFYCTGDSNQIDNIDGDSAEYIQYAIECIFKNRINLTEIKRQSNKEDILKIKKIKTLLFETDTDIKEILNMFPRIKVDECYSNAVNICYFNDSCNRVNNLFSNGIRQGTTVICKKYFQIKGKTLNTNYLYTVKSIDNNNIIVTDDNEEYIIPVNRTKQLFKPAISFTAHSVQGLSFDDNIIIFDAYSHMITRKWLWVAITRARNLSQIKICTDLRYCEDIKNLGSKIDSYRETDILKGCNFKEHPLITKTQIREKIVNQLYCCYHCRQPISLNYDNDDMMQWSLDRISNSGYHTNKNTVVSCLSCNHSKK